MDVMVGHSTDVTDVMVGHPTEAGHGFTVSQKMLFANKLCDIQWDLYKNAAIITDQHIIM